jgi:hypothetical protein
MSKLKTIDIEIAVARFLNPRVNLIVDNISWGMGLHECDLLAVTKNNYLWQVEIKISKADLIKDLGKRHGHCSDKIKRLYFAIPDYLQDEIKYIPARAGVIVVDSRLQWPVRFIKRYVHVIREPINNGKYKISNDEYTKIAHLGAMRIWGLKQKIKKLSNE